MATKFPDTTRRALLANAAALPVAGAVGTAAAAPVASPMSPAVADAFHRWVAMDRAVVSDVLPQQDVAEDAVWAARRDGVTGPALDALEAAKDAVLERVNAAWDEVREARFAVLELPAVTLGDLCAKLQAAADVTRPAQFDGAAGIDRHEFVLFWRDLMRLGGVA